MSDYLRQTYKFLQITPDDRLQARQLAVDLQLNPTKLEELMTLMVKAITSAKASMGQLSPQQRTRMITSTFNQREAQENLLRLEAAISLIEVLVGLDDSGRPTFTINLN